MTVFAVIAKELKPELESALAISYTNDHYRFADRVWFLVDRGTALEVSQKLNVRNGDITGVLVMALTGESWGVVSGEFWNWLHSARSGEHSRHHGTAGSHPHR
jgi:hypothetical protein